MEENIFKEGCKREKTKHKEKKIQNKDYKSTFILNATQKAEVKCGTKKMRHAND